jgi:hypothetical protein
MKHSMIADATSAGTTINETLTSQEAAQRLVDSLQGTHPCGDEEFQVSMTDHFGRRNPDTNEVEIELPDNLLEHPLAARAIATLLKVTGSYAAWVRHVGTHDNGLSGPLRFRLEKRAAWAGDFWSWCRYVVVDHVGDDLDLEAAARQITALIAHLADARNLVELGPEELALF